MGVGAFAGWSSVAWAEGGFEGGFAQGAAPGRERDRHGERDRERGDAGVDGERDCEWVAAVRASA